MDRRAELLAQEEKKVKLTSLVVAAALLAAGGTASAQETVRIGTEGAYPPWNETDPAGNLVGFEVDLGNAMCEKMGVTCEWVAQDWDGIIPALLNGRYDLIMAGMSITEERRQAIEFSDGYVTDPAMFVAAAATFKGTIRASFSIFIWFKAKDVIFPLKDASSVE